MKHSNIRVTTSGFSFEDWRGIVYPSDLRQNEMLTYYERNLGFDCTELNYTYYSMPNPSGLQAMLDRTGSDFQFLVRSHAEMTHKIWEDEERTRLKDTHEVFDRFLQGCAPLIRAGRLGCILLQFPSYFFPRPENYEYLSKCRQWLPDVPVSVEFRNAAWDRDQTYEFLKEHNLGFGIVDEPRFRQLMPFVLKLTSDIGYFRLHGRSQNWFKESKELRYDYFYSEKELREFVPSIRYIAEQSRVTYVAFNNCHAGSAARNALMTKNFLDLINYDEFTPEQRHAIRGKVDARAGGELGL